MLTSFAEGMAKRQRVQATGRVSAKPDRRIHSELVAPERATVIDEFYQQGSARIRFPNTPPGALHAILLNTAGGLTGDDHMHWQATAGADAHLCVSTSACEKIYCTHGPAAKQQTTLKIASGARLEWLPQETILFNGSCLERSMHVELDENAEALLVESLVFGRQAMQETTDLIRVKDRWRIHYGNRLLHAEDFRLDMSGGLIAHRMCILHQYSAMSTIVLISQQHDEWYAAIASRLRRVASNSTGKYRLGVSTLPSRLVVRLLATDSFQLRKILIPCIEILNENRPIPIVWNV